MPFCKDPSVTFLNKFGYNVVRLPRPGIEPMDVLGKRGSLERLGRLSSVWKTAASEPTASAPVALPDIEGKRSDKLDLSIGLRILGNALKGLGAATPSVDVAFKQARKVQFSFSNITSTSVDPLEAGNYLASGDLNTANPIVAQYFLEEDGDAFLIVDVLKSDSVTVQASGENDTDVKLDIPALQQVLGTTVSVAASGANQSSVTFKGPTPITFGFKAFSIAFVNGRWTLVGTKPSGSMAFAVPGEEEEEDGFQPVLLTTSGLLNF